MNFYFTNEIREWLELFSTLMALKTFSGEICSDSLQFQMETRKISRRRPRSADAQNLVISRCCFAEDGKKMFKKL